MAGKIESWLVIAPGARITADGHLQVRATGGGAFTVVPLTAGTYKTFDLAAQELEDQLNALAGGIGAWTVTVSANSVNIACSAAYDLSWQDQEVKEYFGFGADDVTNQTSIDSDEPPRGKITLVNPIDIDFFIILPHRHAQDHTSKRFGYSYPLRFGQKCRFMLGNDEIVHFYVCADRMQQGYPVRVWLDASLAGSFDWTNADWKKGRDLALQDTSAVVSLTDYLSLPAAYHRRVELQMVEAG